MNEPMQKTTVIKFRTTARHKAELEDFAGARNMSVSQLLRSASNQVVMGRPADGGVRSDMARVRSCSNVLCDVLEKATADPKTQQDARRALATLRLIASRHLGTGS
jgi:hypothetical protein